MTIPSYTDGDQTNPLHAAVLNAICQAIYGALGDVSNNPPVNAAQVLANLGITGAGATQGAGLVPFNQALLYPGGTVGNELLALIAAQAAGAPSGPNGTPFNFRNRLYNGLFRIHQRLGYLVTIPGSASSNYWILDRWYFYTAGAAQQCVIQQVSYNQNGFLYLAQVGRKETETGTSPIGIAQPLSTNESVSLQGGPIVVSIFAKAGANFSGANLSVQVVSGTGTDQGAGALVAGTWTGATNVINATTPLTTTLTRYTFTGNVPTNSTQLGVIISYTPSGTAGTDDNFYLAAVQLEAGSTATPIEFTPYQLDLQNCLRYYEEGTASFFSYNTAGGTIGYSVSFLAQKRAVPTTQVSLNSHTNCSVPSLSNNAITLYIESTVTATGAASFDCAWTADAELR